MMHWPAIRICVVLLAVSTSFLPFAAEPEELRQRIAAKVQLAVAGNAIHGAVLVTNANVAVYREAFGMADLEWQMPNTAETKFRIASLTKSFIAALVLQQVEAETLSLDDPIAKHLQWYREDTGAKVTIHHLLSHTSGIPNYLAIADYFARGSLMPFRTETFIGEYCSGDLAFDPGTKFDYSPSNYLILGAILEKVSGKPLDELLQERILAPLQMNGTGFDDNVSIVERRAEGYDALRSGFRRARYLDMSTAGASGGLYSTVDDLQRWHEALQSDRILSPTSKAPMFRENFEGYAYGWFVHDRDVAGRTVRLHSHGGRINGFNAAIVRAPDDGHLVVILNNVTQYSPYALAFELMDTVIEATR